MSKCNGGLIKAKIEKNDEFYTLYEDIENELQYYTEHFKDKVVYCNCDDARWSNFVKYFLQNFERLGLKKLVATGYSGGGHGVYFEAYSGDTPIEVTELDGDGDFRSEECENILMESDVVVTNPPFSLMKYYIPFVVNHNKKIITLCNINHFTTKDTFPLLVQNKIWCGVRQNSVMNFLYGGEGEDNGGIVHVGGCGFVTNINHSNMWKGAPTNKRYMKGLYPKFDGTDIICINSVNNIPCDYFGQMGVPITFFGCYDPSFWNILGTIDSTVKGKEKYKRILIQRKQQLNNQEVQNNV